MSEREPSPEPEVSNRERLINVAREVLSQDAFEGLLELDLDEEELLMAIYGELDLAGVEDPWELLRGHGIE